VEGILILLGGTCLLSLPIFYIWGLVAFFQTTFGDKNQQRTSGGNDEDAAHGLIRELRRRAIQNPDITLRSVLAEMGYVAAPRSSDEDVAPSTTADEAADEAEIDSMMEDVVGKMRWEAESQAEGERQKRDAQPQHEPAPEPSGGGLTLVNLMLYLGAFLIVAAVSLFVGFNWGSFGGGLRFALVLMFTASWYAGGVILARALNLETASIAFITIGALLTPLCGVAFHIFVLGNPAGVGPTWLVTSLLTTVLYLGLSLIYRRRFFTYFGSLSTLAMVLALVEISDAPSEYFILTANITALLLLLVRIGLRFAPERERDYFSNDIEFASLGTLFASVALGLLVAADGGIPFYSVEVTAVLIVVTIYAWTYVSLRLLTPSLVGAQVVTVYTVNHLLITSGITGAPLQLIVAGVHLGLLVGLNLWLREREDKQIYHRFNLAALALTFTLYSWTAVSSTPEFIAMVFAAGLGMHAFYVAALHKQPWLYHITAFVPYMMAIHLLNFIDAGAYLGFSVMLAVSVAVLLVGYAPVPIPDLRRAFARMGLAGLGFWYVVLIADGSVSDPTDPRWVALVSVTPLAYLLFGLYELRARERLLVPWVHLLTAGVTLVGYVFAMDTGDHRVMATAALVPGVLFAVAYLHTRLPIVVIGPVLSAYAVLTHLLAMADAPVEAYPVALSLLSVVIYIVPWAVRALPRETYAPVKITVMASLAALYILTYGYAFDRAPSDVQRLVVAGWVPGYVLLVLLFIERSLMSERVRDLLLLANGLTLYWLHILYLQEYVNPSVFSDVQWYSAALGTVILLLGWREARRGTEEGVLAMADVLGATVLLLPTFSQVIFEGEVVYFLLGIAYALAFAGIGAITGRVLTQRIGIVSLVAVVLFQSSEFLFGLPRWFIVGLVGFGLIGGAVYLSMRANRRTEKRQG